LHPKTFDTMTKSLGIKNPVTESLMTKSQLGIKASESLQLMKSDKNLTLGIWSLGIRSIAIQLIGI